MKKTLGRTDPVRAVSFSLWFRVITPAMLAAIFANVERHIRLCLQAEGNEFQSVL
jgi:hypothetical protein